VQPYVIAPEADLDLHTTDELRAALNLAGGDVSRGVVVDLTAVTFMDSAVLGALLQAHERLRRSGQVMAVVVPPGSAAAVVLSLSGLERRLAIYDNPRAALDAAEQTGA
jgi:anti-sigma B factor antagonist